MPGKARRKKPNPKRAETSKGTQSAARAHEVGPWAHVGSQRPTTAWPHRIHGIKSAAAKAPKLKVNTLYRLVLGIEPEPKIMSTSEIEKLKDPMGGLLKSGKFPLTAYELLPLLDQIPSLDKQFSYLVSEAAQIDPKTAPRLKRDMRFTIVRDRLEQADVLISTSASDDPRTGFLQVIAWDPAEKFFNYYMRIEDTWVWAGNSLHALEAPSRANACFDSHVNGGLVMKELKIPWMNWESSTGTVLLKADDPIRENPLYERLAGAQVLELQVRTGIMRWTATRLERFVKNGLVTHPDWLLRQLFGTTTVNLVTSMSESRVLADDPLVHLTPPLGFWLNEDALLNDLLIPASFDSPKAPSPLYAASLKKYDFALVQNSFRQPGDTFFAFAVPTSAFEDTEVINQMIKNGFINPRFAASASMVDFTNPVFSERRAGLMKYVPTDPMTLDPRGGGLANQIAGAIKEAAAGLPPNSPEAEFTANYSLAPAEWPSEFGGRIDKYMTAVAKRIKTPEGFDDYVRLAESRRRQFRVMRLNEFSLSIPVTNISADAPLLQMNPDGTISEKSA